MNRQRKICLNQNLKVFKSRSEGKLLVPGADPAKIFMGAEKCR